MRDIAGALGVRLRDEDLGMSDTGRGYYHHYGKLYQFPRPKAMAATGWLRLRPVLPHPRGRCPSRYTFYMFYTAKNSPRLRVSARESSAAQRGLCGIPVRAVHADAV